MDFTILLVIPLGVLVALIFLLSAAARSQPRPRLIWPFTVTLLIGSVLSLRLPNSNGVAIWFFAFLILAWWAAVATVIGSIVASAVLATVRWLQRS